MNLLLKNCWVMLSITTRCQCTCSHCGAYYHQFGAKKKDFDRDELFQNLDKLADLGVQGIYILGGEPLLHPNFFEIIEYLQKKHLKCAIDTNGSLVDEETIIKMKKAGVAILRLSLDSPYEEIHDKNRGIKGLYKKCIEGLKLCKTHNLNCCIAAVINKQNLYSGDFDKLLSIAREMDVKLRFVTTVYCGRLSGDESQELTKEDLMKIKNYVEPGKVFWDQWDKKTPVKPCNALDKIHFHITGDGDITPCVYCHLKFGNINEEPLEDIVRKMWGSDIYQKKYNEFDCLTKYSSLKKS